ncbi:uncharacterized protein NECHADRAFT_106105 [Fusarium vanettenii 77-13-4]|uniref:Uncharacterized protein n=1 Tax=Fusarium vanettenii (strain ATCC MYA-4622 / CBS 123669 / FGSC 9596 / NRRL 45880 / 77-13-4) TaxID=660122 RepID=C7Z0J4_FUSV7|nr:uncharacterized protein NECHADRAFT_106105 [Fusarium vanettenii 77-13-4]EEU42216.1 predicted protein [Fusarium vanettenii 77-13-4]
MLSTFLLLLLATTSLAMPQPTAQPTPQPTPELLKRNATTNSTRHDCLRNCTSQCGHGGVCDLVCSILKCPPNMKRADLSGEFEEVARRSEEEKEEEEEDGFEDVEVVETGHVN